MKAKPICLWLFRQAVDRPFSFARARAGRSSPANIAMMAITTSNSIRVKPSGAESERFDRDRFNERNLCPESAVGNRYFVSRAWPSGKPRSRGECGAKSAPWWARKDSTDVKCGAGHVADKAKREEYERLMRQKKTKPPKSDDYDARGPHNTC